MGSLNHVHIISSISNSKKGLIELNQLTVDEEGSYLRLLQWGSSVDDDCIQLISNWEEVHFEVFLGSDGSYEDSINDETVSASSIQG